MTSMKDLWRPIEELEDKYADGLLVAAPELVHGDWNPRGVSRAYYQDDEGWIGTGWCGCHDEPTRVVVNPTHFIQIETPYTKEELELFEQQNYDRED